MAGHIFISYSRNDSVYVLQLVDHLRQAGLEVWFDETVDYGDRWVKLISQKIDSCAAFIVVMTPAAAEAEWVEREITHAITASRLILPILLSGTPLFQINNRQWVSVVGGKMPDAAFVTRLRAVTSEAATSAGGQSIVERSGSPQPPPLLIPGLVPGLGDNRDLVRVVSVTLGMRAAGIRATGIRATDMRTAAKHAAVQRWLRQAGDQVERGTPLLEVTIDNRLDVIESPARGILRGVIAVEGEIIDSMTTVGIVVIGAAGGVPQQRRAPRPHGTLLRTAEIRLPSLGTAGRPTIAIWWRQVGDRIESGQPLLQITNRDVELDSIATVTGTIRAIAVVEGETPDVDQVVGIVALD